MTPFDSTTIISRGCYAPPPIGSSEQETHLFTCSTCFGKVSSIYRLMDGERHYCWDCYKDAYRQDLIIKATRRAFALDLAIFETAIYKLMHGEVFPIKVKNGVVIEAVRDGVYNSVHLTMNEANSLSKDLEKIIQSLKEEEANDARA